MDALIHPSIAIPNLPTIPQSAVPSPTSQRSPRGPTTPPLPIPHPQPSVPFPQRDGTDGSGTTRRSSLSRLPPAEGSYFPPTPSPGSRVASSNSSPGGTSRPRPPPLVLPTDSPDDADYGITPTTKGKGKEKARDLVSDSPEQLRPACEIDREDPDEAVALRAIDPPNPHKSPSVGSIVRLIKKRSSASILGDRSDESVRISLRQSLSNLKEGLRRPASKSPETTLTPLHPLPPPCPERRISPKTRSRSFDSSKIDFSAPPPVTAESSLRRSKTVSHPRSPKSQSLLFTGECSPRHDETSVETHTSVSAGAFSPMSLTNNHPLSSATTSLSRSAKSGKEGHPGKAKEMGSEDSLDSVKQWKTKQKVHHDRLEVRKQSLLELVEKTVSHAHALDILESVYLSSANSSSLPASAVEIIRKLRPMVARIRKVNNRVKDIMVSVLKEEGIGYGQSMGKRRSEGDVFETEAEREQEERAHMEVMGEEFEERLDRAVSKISVAMLAEEKGFRKYTKLCVTGLNANKVFSGVSNGDRERFEARCQAQMDSREHYDLSALLETSTLGLTSVSKRRLHFQDFLHAPYQRIPGLVLLLQRVQDSFKGLPIKVGDDLDATSRAYVDVGRLREMIARVGTTTDSARGVKMKEEATETLISRMDAHSEVTPEVLRSLGTCRLIGSLNVLYQHIEPLPKQATVKHLAAFLFDGYLILAKVKKNQKVYEPRHFFPLSMFVMYGVTTGPISPSIRLESGRFSYFLGALSAEEQAIWHDALDVARDKHVSPYAVPTSLPVSITQAIQEGWIEDAWKSSADITKPISSPQQTPALSRRASMGATKSLDLERITPVTRAKRRSPEKRHTMTGLPTKSLNPDDILSALKTVDAKSKNDSEPSTPVKSPVRTTFTAMTPDRNKELTQTLKQPQKSMIDNVMHGLEGIFDNQCAQIRAGETIRKSQSMGASSRRKSTTQLVGFKDSIGATVFTGAVTESVIPKREPTLGHVKGKPSLPDDWQPGETSELPPAVADSDEEEDEDEQEEESGGTSRPISEFGASTSRQPLPRNGSSTSLFGVPSSKSSFLFMSASNDDSRNSLRMRTKRDKTRKGAALAENEIAKEKEKDPVGHARKKSEPTRRKISSKEGMAHYTHIREKSQPASPMLSPAHEQPSFEISLRHEDEQAVYDSGSTTAPAEETVEEMAEGEDGVLLTAPGLKRRSFSYDSTPIARRPGPSRRITPPEYSIPEPHGPAPVQPFGASFGGFFDRSRRDSDRSRKDSRTSAESAAPGGLSRRSSFVSVKSSLKRSLSGISLLSTRKSPNIEVPGIGIDDGTGSSAQSTPGTEFSPMSPITGLYGAEDDYGRDALEMKRVAPTRQKSFKNLYGLGFSSMKPERG